MADVKALKIKTNGNTGEVNPAADSFQLVSLGLGVASPTFGLAAAGTASPGVSAANTGRLYYDLATNKWKISENGGAFTDLGGGGMAIGGTVTSGTTGSILFVGAGPVLAQDNANFFWDNTSKRIGVGINTPLSFASVNADGIDVYANNGSDSYSPIIRATNVGVGGFDVGGSLWLGAGGGFGSEGQVQLYARRAPTSPGGVDLYTQLHSGGGAFTDNLRLAGNGGVALGVPITTAPIAAVHIQRRLANQWLLLGSGNATDGSNGSFINATSTFPNNTGFLVLGGDASAPYVGSGGATQVTLSGFSGAANYLGFHIINRFSATSARAGMLAMWDDSGRNPVTNNYMIMLRTGDGSSILGAPVYVSMSAPDSSLFIRHNGFTGHNTANSATRVDVREGTLGVTTGVDTFPPGNVASKTGTTVTATSGGFSPSDVGSYLLWPYGVSSGGVETVDIITAYNSATSVEVNNSASISSRNFIVRAARFAATTDGVGIEHAIPNTKLDVNGDFAHRAVSPAAFTGTQNDYAAAAGYSFARLDGSSTPVITGITDGFDGKRLVIANVGATAIQFNNQDAGSTAGNRIITGTGGNISLAADETMELIYDAVTARWRKLL